MIASPGCSSLQLNHLSRWSRLKGDAAAGADVDADEVWGLDFDDVADAVADGAQEAGL